MEKKSLKEICIENLNKMYPDSISEAMKERLDWEISVLKETGQEWIPLRVRELLDKAELKPYEYIAVAGAGNLLVSHALDITPEIDPMNLTPKFVFGKNRDKMLSFFIHVPKESLIARYYEDEHGKRIDDERYATIAFIPDPAKSMVSFCLRSEELDPENIGRKEGTITFGVDDGLASFFVTTIDLGLHTYTYGFGGAFRGCGLPANEKMLDLLSLLPTGGISELERVMAANIGSGIITESIRGMLRNGEISESELFLTRDEVYSGLMEIGIGEDTAFSIAEDVRKGKGLKDKYRGLLMESGMPEWKIDYLDEVRYLTTKAYAISKAKKIWILAFFKAHHTKIFYNAYVNHMISKEEGHAYNDMLPGVITLVDMLDYLNRDKEPKGFTPEEVERINENYQVIQEMYERGSGFMQ